MTTNSLLLLGVAATALVIFTFASMFSALHRGRTRILDAESGLSAALGRRLLHFIGRKRKVEEILDVPPSLNGRDSPIDPTDAHVTALLTYTPKFPQLPPLPYVPPRVLPARLSVPAPSVKVVRTDEIEALHEICESPNVVRFEDIGARRAFPPPSVLPSARSLPPFSEEVLTLEAAAPHLTLPYYGGTGSGLEAPQINGPWAAIYRVLNRFVYVANIEAIGRYRKLVEIASADHATISDINARRRIALDQAVERWRNASQFFETEKVEWNTEYAHRFAAHKQSEVDYQEALITLRKGMQQRRADAVEQYYCLNGSHIELPPAFPRNPTVKYDTESRILIVDIQAPDLASVEVVKSIVRKSGKVDRPVSSRERRRLEATMIEGLTLFVAIALARLDSDDCLAAVAINTFVHHLDSRTGHPRDTYIASLFAEKRQLLAIDPKGVDPIACFSSLKGRHIRGGDELEAIQPIVRLDMRDERIVPARDVLAGMQDGENLASMDWEDFEHLVRELFEREFGANGARVEITRASRDRGVDAIVFDPDPIRGGKYVIQAKRYTIPVDVAAVRELYGTVVNEGAMKGVLVSTASFGPDAYSFAKDKPLTLVPGPELLGLLERHGYRFRIDIAEARNRFKL